MPLSGRERTERPGRRLPAAERADRIRALRMRSPASPKRVPWGVTSRSLPGLMGSMALPTTYTVSQSEFDIMPNIDRPKYFDKIFFILRHIM